MKRFTVRHLLYCLLAIFFMPPLLAPRSIAAEENRPATIAFLPFKIQAGQGLNYLKEGVRDMLASRLAAHAGLVVVDKRQTDSAWHAAGDQRSLPELRSLGSNVGADYLVTGSLTSLDAGLSIDTTVIRTTADGPPQSFHVTAGTLDQLIPAVDQLAQEINTRIFAPPAAPTATAPQPDSPGNSQLETAHPDRAFIPPPPSSPSTQGDRLQ